jgi:hypothetical protein
MSAKRLLVLRILVIVLLVLLAFQFELGMAVNIANPPSIAPIAFSFSGLSTGVNDALNRAGGAAQFHAGLGSLLVLLSVVNLVLSLRSGARGAQIFGVLAFLTTSLAATTGLLFVLSGFQNDGDSHGMATNFILSFAFYFLELYFLKPAPQTRLN